MVFGVRKLPLGHWLIPNNVRGSGTHGSKKIVAGPSGQYFFPGLSWGEGSKEGQTLPSEGREAPTVCFRFPTERGEGLYPDMLG